jgi:hypothetical protein
MTKTFTLARAREDICIDPHAVKDLWSKENE